MRGARIFISFVFLSALFSFPGWIAKAEPVDRSQYIFDYANLLTNEERAALQSLASELGAERETAFLIITLNGTGRPNIEDYVNEFYDRGAPGYDRPHGNTAILTIDLLEKDVDLGGFKKAEVYLDDQRLDLIRERITPALTEGRYFEAFSDFIATAHDYMRYKPGVNPENILFQWWFQIAISIGLAAIIVFMMAYRSGGRVTINARTYLDSQRSRVIDRSDRYVRKSVTRQRKPSSNRSSSGGGGGGGMTRGGHSRSGSRGKF